MRQIKFRFWFKKRESFKRFPEIAIKSNGVIMVNEDDHWYECLEDSFEIQQFTGIKDKNAKDIYEGDILEVEFQRVSGYGVEDDEYDGDGIYIGIVAFRPSKGFILKGIIETYEDGDPTKIKNIRPIAAYRSKVIGNIHENPELIKD